MNTPSEREHSAKVAQVPRYGLRPPQVVEALGSPELARRAIFHGWLKPIIQQKKLTLYDAGDVACVYQRLRAGEIPAAIPRRTSRS